MAELVVEGQVCLLNQLYMNTCPNNNTGYIVNDNNNYVFYYSFFYSFFYLAMIIIIYKIFVILSI